jgi:hypothetical protein
MLCLCHVCVMFVSCSRCVCVVFVSCSRCVYVVHVVFVSCSCPVMFCRVRVLAIFLSC